MLRYWRRPEARLAEGRLLAKHGLATSCQDTSDGLKATIEQLGEASGVGFRIYGDKIPIPPSVSAVAGLLDVDETALALSASVDFQLAFTVSPAHREALENAFATKGLPQPILIGVAASEQYHQVVGSAGKTLPGVAWRHQTGPVSEAISAGLRSTKRGS